MPQQLFKDPVEEGDSRQVRNVQIYGKEIPSATELSTSKYIMGNGL